MLYCLVALVTVFAGLGLTRQYIPDLYSGFTMGINRLPFVEQLRAGLPSLPPLLSGEQGLIALSPENDSSEITEADSEIPHLIDEEEMRGVWIATVYSIDFPRVRNDKERQKQELIDILNMAKSAGLNTIFFQVRPHGDALYPSSLFPWSEYLTGTAGQDPDYDPLAFLLEEAEQRGIRVHAWINPYRLTMGTGASPQNTHAFLPEGSPVKDRQDLTLACGDGKLYLNPGEPEAMKLVVNGVREIVENYNIDGIHFDDYFYPSDMSYDDSATYEKYGQPAGLSLEDWRRQNTTTLMRMVRDAIKEIRPGVEFGISPSGIWQNKQSTPLGSDTNGFESHNRIFADSRLWVTEEIVDYIIPQIYWAIGTKGSDYDVLVRWWRNVTLGANVRLYIGHAAYRVGTDGLWLKPTEIGSQITLNRALGAIDGSVFYGYSKIAENALGLRDQLKELFLDTELAQDLKIAYPASGSTLSSANSYIIGSADPRYPLYVNGSLVDRTVSGYFCVYASLEVGNNEFLFTYQDEELAYSLIRSQPPAGGGGGGGGTVEPPKPVVLPKPLVYVTKEDETVVRAEASSNAERMQPLKKGVKGYVTAELNGYYLMDSGNWTYKPNVEILAEGNLPISQTGSAVIIPGEAGVEIAFRLPYFTSYYVDVTAEELRLTLHNTIGQPLLREGVDPLFKDEIAFGQEGMHAVYTLQLKTYGRLYGYHIRYDETTNILSFLFNNPLTLSASGLQKPPLSGMVIALDAGHGGRDNGATGPAGSRGKLEKDVNLDLALVLESVLREAGAEVMMIRRDDSYLDLEPRANRIRSWKPDLAISLHRNSLGADRDIRTFFGALALYTHPQSASLAGYLRDALVNGTTHHDGGMRWQSLAMCRLEECPAVLLELGFISNPADYERMTRKSTIQKEAQAILRGILAYMADSESKPVTESAIAAEIAEDPLTKPDNA